MSQETSTVFGSCGLIVGLNIAPPPPGPMMRKPPGLSARAQVRHTTTEIVRKIRIRSFISSCLMLLRWVIPLPSQWLYPWRDRESAARHSGHATQRPVCRSGLVLERYPEPQAHRAAAVHALL